MLRLFVKRRMVAGITVAQLRRRIRRIERFIPAPPRRVQTTQFELGTLKASSIVASAIAEDRHILYFHGGAFVSGSPALYRDLTWRIAKRAKARLIALDYRLAPEFPFPSAVQDAAAAYRHLIESGVDPHHIALLGDSAGGGLVFSALLKIRDEGMPMPAAVVAISPWVDLALTRNPPIAHARAESIMTVGLMKELADQYLQGVDPKNPYASPLYGNLAGLPPALIQVGSDELLFYDAIRMAERLRGSGCSIELEIWPRLPHSWQMFAKLLPEARQSIVRIAQFLDARMSCFACQSGTR